MSHPTWRKVRETAHLQASMNNLSINGSHYRLPHRWSRRYFRDFFFLLFFWSSLHHRVISHLCGCTWAGLICSSQNKTSGFDKRVTLMHSLLSWVTGGSRFLPTLNLDPLILGFHFAELFSVAVVSPHALMLALKAAKAAAPNSYSSFLAPGPCFRFIRFAVLLVP